MLSLYLIVQLAIHLLLLGYCALQAFRALKSPAFTAALALAGAKLLLLLYFFFLSPYGISTLYSALSLAADLAILVLILSAALKVPSKAPHGLATAALLLDIVIKGVSVINHYQILNALPGGAAMVIYKVLNFANYLIMVGLVLAIVFSLAGGKASSAKPQA
jgi:hypothetical protein